VEMRSSLQEELSLRICLGFLEEKVRCLREQLCDMPTELAFHLDKVAISYWGDEKSMTDVGKAFRWWPVS
jgi:hypothetical protein